MGPPDILLATYVMTEAAMRSLRFVLLHILRLFGGFALARRLTRGQLRILCYHGFSLGTEYRASPYVFMRATIFERRMRILQKLRIPVIPLEEAVDRLHGAALVDAETVITFDDGWESNLTIGAPILRHYGYPACIYVTTDHLHSGTEAFNMALAHMVHESPKSIVALRNIHPILDGDYELKTDPLATVRTLLDRAIRVAPLPDRQRLLRPIAEALGLDYVKFFANGRFRLLDGDQIRKLALMGVSIQLHTHTHTLPDDSFDSVANEIEQNRAAIRRLIGLEPRHFCYPSGKHSPQHPEWLARLGIISATTCNAGFNRPTTPLLLLNRYLDSELSSDIEFEAEIVGVREVLRRIRARFSANTASDARRGEERLPSPH